MKLNLWVIAAAVAIVAIVYFAFTSVQSQTYTGRSLTFDTSGIITLENTSDAPVTMRATASRSFTLGSTNPEQRSLTSVREGTGRTAIQVVDAELPPGTTELTVRRGSGITFTMNADSSIKATVAPRDADGNRNIVIAAVVVCLGLLAYISFSTEHAWMNLLRGGKSSREMTTQSA